MREENSSLQGIAQANTAELANNVQGNDTKAEPNCGTAANEECNKTLLGYFTQRTANLANQRQTHETIAATQNNRKAGSQFSSSATQQVQITRLLTKTAELEPTKPVALHGYDITDSANTAIATWPALNAAKLVILLPWHCPACEEFLRIQ